MSLVSLQDVTKKFKDNLVLENVSLEVQENKITGIIGVNGSGKTTILRLIVGFYKPSSGLVVYNGKKLSSAMNEVKRDFGFTTQDSSFYPKLTVEENIRYFGSLYGMSKVKIDQNIDKVLQLMELDHVRHMISEKLSGGMQRRLDMACSIIHVPKVLILDEPTEDLDPLLRHDILRLIKKINSIGTTIIITSHLLDDVENLCDNLIVVHNRKIIKSCTINELREEYKVKEQVHLKTFPGNYQLILDHMRLQNARVEDGVLVVESENAERTLHELLHFIENSDEKLVYVDIKKPSLVEIFENLTKVRAEQFLAK